LESRTEKGLLGTLRRGPAAKLVGDLLEEAEKFFEKVESACEELRHRQTAEYESGPDEMSKVKASRRWTELRIRHADLVPDNLTLPIQRLRESISELVKMSEDKDMARNWWNAIGAWANCGTKWRFSSAKAQPSTSIGSSAPAKRRRTSPSTPLPSMSPIFCAGVSLQRYLGADDQRDPGNCKRWSFNPPIFRIQF